MAVHKSVNFEIAQSLVSTFCENPPTALMVLIAMPIRIECDNVLAVQLKTEKGFSGVHRIALACVLRLYIDVKFPPDPESAHWVNTINKEVEQLRTLGVPIPPKNDDEAMVEYFLRLIHLLSEQRTALSKPEVTRRG